MRGSFVNAIMGGGNAAPEVGMGVTVLMYTDRFPGTIVSVSASGKSFKFREDKAVRSDTHGMSDSQSYQYEADESAPVRTARLTKKGWSDNGTRIHVGSRSRYHDYSF